MVWILNLVNYGKNLTKNFENQNLAQENNFDSIKITLASPEKLSHGHSGN